MNDETPSQVLWRFFTIYGILTIAAVLIGVMLWVLLDWWPVISTGALILIGIVYGWIGGLVWRDYFGD